jgi:membrane protease YdiL (CAAX protease family)
LALLLGAAYFEELIFRFGLVNACVFLVMWMMRQASASQLALWIGIAVAAVAFAGLHLIPLGMLLQVSPSFLVGAFAIAMVGGIGFGLIFVKHGLHFAMLSHALAGPPLYLIVRFGFLEK